LSSHLSLRRLCAISLALTGLALGACGGSDDNSSSGSGSSSGGSSTSSSSSSGGGGGEKLSLAAQDSGGLSFDKKTLKAKAGNVTLTMDNPSGNSQPHAIGVEGNGVDKEGETVQPGSAKSTVTVKLKPGKYTFYCPVDGHRQAGMEGTLTVQ
jgi:uncharacterized cupredoxin-like copper-binding protein